MLTRRTFTKGILNSLLTCSLLKTLYGFDLFASSVRPITNRWLINVEQLSHDLKGNKLTQIEWQKNIKELFARVELPDIGNEVGFDAAGQAVAKGDVLLGKVVRLRVALEKMKIVAEDKFFIVKELHIKRRRSDAQKPRLRVHGVVLVPNIGRNCKGRSYLPFEGFFAAVVVPQSGGSLAFDDDGYFIKQLPSRRGSLRGRDFQNVGVIELGSGKINERAVGIARAPKFNGNYARVFHKEARMNGNTLGLLPN